MGDSRHQDIMNELDSKQKSRIPRPLGERNLQRSQSFQASRCHWPSKFAASKNFRGQSFESDISTDKLFQLTKTMDKAHRRQSSCSFSNSELASIFSTPVPFSDADAISLKSFGSACSAFSLDAFTRSKSNSSESPHCSGKRKNILHCQSHHVIQPEYLTPTQRSAREIRQLRAMLVKTQKQLEVKNNDYLQLTKQLMELHMEKEECSPKPEDMKDDKLDDDVVVLSKSCDSGQFDASEYSDAGGKTEVDDALKASIQTELTATNKNLYEKNNIEEYYRQQFEEMKRQHAVEYQEQKEKYNDKIENLLLKLSEANSRYFDLLPQVDRSQERIRKLETQIHVLEEERRQQENRHHQMYLKMYKKGQEAARFEHADEVMEFAHHAPNRTSVPELLQQLHSTEHELERMKNLYRHEMYKKADGVRDPEVTLRFLKDALYYFLTNKENKGHLQAIESILGYSEIECMNIERTMLNRHKLFK